MSKSCVKFYALQCNGINVHYFRSELAAKVKLGALKTELRKRGPYEAVSTEMEYKCSFGWDEKPIHWRIVDLDFEE